MAISAVTPIRATPHRFVVLLTEDANPASTFSWNILADYLAAGGLATSPFYTTLAAALANQTAARVMFDNWYDCFGTTRAAVAPAKPETPAAFVRYEAPIAQELVTIKAAVNVANGPATAPLAQPDCPRCFTVNLAGGAGINAGNLRFIGFGASGEALILDVSLVTNVPVLLITTKAFSVLTSWQVTGLDGGAGMTLSIGVAAALGLPASSNPIPNSWAVYKTIVDAADEAVAGVDTVNGTVLPTTVPNAVHNYSFFYNYSVANSISAASLSVDQNVNAPNVAGNFRLDLTSVKNSATDTASYVLDVVFRHSVPL